MIPRPIRRLLLLLAVPLLLLSAWSAYGAIAMLRAGASGDGSPQSMAERIPAPFQDEAAAITQGYEDAYFGPIREVGELEQNPQAPDPQVVVPPSAQAVEEQLQQQPARNG